MRVVLDCHCRSQLVLPAWAPYGGYTATEWWSGEGLLLDEAPRPGERHRLRVAPPFVAEAGHPFFTRWQPALVAANGWETETAHRLGDLRVVRCLFIDDLGPTRSLLPDHRPQRELLVEVQACHDPIELSRQCSPLPLDLSPLSPLLLDGACKELVRADDRTLVTTSLEGDLQVEFLLDHDEETVALVADRSLCQGFFWVGRGQIDPALWSRLQAEAAFLLPSK